MFASGSETRIAYIPEVTFGTTPATPAFNVLRATQSTLRPNKNTVQSEEIRADRNVADLIKTGESVSGELAGELSYGSWDDLLAAALCSDWTTNVLKNGVAQKFFTLEETYELGATNVFSRFTGCMLDRLQMSIVARQIVTLRATVMGRANALDDAIITGATYNAANTNAVQAAPSGVAALSLSDGGGAIAAKIRSINLDIANNLRERPVIDSLYSEEMGKGRHVVTGTIEAYFQSKDLMQKVLDHGTGVLSMTLGTVTAEKYTILLPKIRFGEGAIGQRDNNSDVMQTIPFQAIYDTAEACSIKITRAVA